MSHTLPAVPNAEMDAICARKNTITERIRAVDPFVALEARFHVDDPTYWAALRLAAVRRDYYDALAHVRCTHESTELRLEWLDAIVDCEPWSVAQLESEIEFAIRHQLPHDAFIAWAHACIDDATWEALRTARRQLAGKVDRG